MSREDRYGLPLTTTSHHAVDAYVEGVDRLLSAQPGADRCLRMALDADPGFAMAHIALARVLQLRMEAAEARSVATRARTLARNVTPREKGHIDTIARAVEGDAAGARQSVDAHCADFPRDAMVLQLNFGAFGLISFAGKRDHDDEMLQLFSRYVDAYGDDWWFRFAWGWAHTEAGRVKEGRKLMDQAMALNGRNANAAHGIAHLHYEEGDSPGGIAFLHRWLPTYERGASLHCHLTWHLALAELVRGDLAGARAAFEEGIRARVATLAPPTNVVTDSASLLWRFALDGNAVDPADWTEVAAFAEERFPSTAPHFHELHCCMSWAAAGAWDLYDRRLAELRDRVGRGVVPPGAVVPALVEGFGAYARGDYAGAVRAIEPYVEDICRVGGSHAQQDVFEETLISAWIRTGQAEKAAAALRARLERRPSPRAEMWLARATGAAA